MNSKRKIEVFSAGCPFCEEAIVLVKGMACSACEVEVLNMQEPKVAEKAKQYGIHRIPAVVIDGKLAKCCSNNGLSEPDLRTAAIGSPLAG